MEDDRLNSPNTSAVKIEVLGHHLQFSQDPNSKHLGTTVWDASMVFVKFLERNCRKGRFCPAKMKGKRAIELGAGCGLAGFGMSLLGCEVVSTDQVEVLPLLMRNVERNTSRIVQTNYDTGSFGSIEVAELDWGNMEQIKAVNPPFDYIIGTDVVYAEHLLEPLLQTIFSLSGPRTTIMLGYEIRSTTVHKQMMDMWKSNFEVKTIPRTKMDPRYQHASIQLFLMGLKNQVGPPQKKILGEADGRASKQESGDDEVCESPSGLPHCSGDEVLNEEYLEVENGKPDEWETRRIGSLAARLLRDVKIK